MGIDSIFIQSCKANDWVNSFTIIQYLVKRNGVDGFQIQPYFLFLISIH